MLRQVYKSALYWARMIAKNNDRGATFFFADH
jgi:hypothetical protein